MTQPIPILRGFGSPTILALCAGYGSQVAASVQRVAA
jgi:hypothetical protein